jgi:two-component system, LytTR family, response regulator
MRRCIIVEDEPLAQKRVMGYIARLPSLQLVGVFENSLDALVFIKNEHPDIIFLDINVEGISGIQLLEKVSIDAAIIITTAYHEFALKGYELNVTDYLLKPFDFERFLQAVEKAFLQLHKNIRPTKATFFFIKTANKTERVDYEDLLFIEGMRDYRKIYTRSRQIMTLQTFKEFEVLLDNDKVCRVHKSYMVAIEKIDSIVKDEIKVGEHTIYVSESYKRILMERISKNKV